MNATRLILPLAALCALTMSLAGCSRQVDNSPSVPRQAVDRAIAATQPQPVTLTNQTLVYECPKCGADYDKAGQCPSDHSELAAMQVAYICPADDLPVDGSGKCPRCQMNARVQKMALNGSGGGTP